MQVPYSLIIIYALGFASYAPASIKNQKQTPLSSPHDNAR